MKISRYLFCVYFRLEIIPNLEFEKELGKMQGMARRPSHNINKTILNRLKKSNFCLFRTRASSQNSINFSDK